MTKTTTAICAAVGAAIVFALLAFTLLPDEEQKSAERANSAEGIAHQTACRSWLLTVSSTGLEAQIENVHTDYYDPAIAGRAMALARAGLLQVATEPQLDDATFEAFRALIPPLDGVRSTLGNYSSAAAAKRSSSLALLDDAKAQVDAACSNT